VVKELVGILQEQLQVETMVLISTAYETISVAKASELVGTSQADMKSSESKKLNSTPN